MEHSVKLELFESYLAPVLDTAYGVALYVDGHPGQAERLVREVATRASDRFASFPSRSDFRVWFLRLMVDRLRDRAGEQPKAEGDARSARPAADEGEVDGLAMSDTLSRQRARGFSPQQVAAAFRRLPPEDRMVCALYFLDDFSYGEIAEIVGSSLPAARARLHCGRQRLSHAMCEMDGRDRTPPRF